MYVRDLRVRYRKRFVHTAPTAAPVRTAADAAAVFTHTLGSEIVEVCGVLCLSTKGRLVAYHELSRGTLDTTIVHPRDVLRTALLANSASIVIGHNHPSGNIQPSPDDVQVTKRLVAAGSVMGIPLVDHIIVNTAGQFFSFREAMML